MMLIAFLTAILWLVVVAFSVVPVMSRIDDALWKRGIEFSMPMVFGVTTAYLVVAVAGFFGIIAAFMAFGLI